MAIQSKTKSSLPHAGIALKVLFLSASVLPFSAIALAQDADAPIETTTDASDADRTLDTVTVTGTRQVIQSSIGIKRNATEIVDGLSAADIGDLPALSIGEALETITGAASHRENGGATEISIRGLGPFLSSTVVNGREATNGSGDRSVNFSQFPSELMNKLEIYKTQNASQIEGGVAGQIQLETIKPLDYGKRRIQFDLKGNVNPDQLNIEGSEAGDLGYRGTLSYVDQFDFGELGEVGLSFGLQRSDISQPEAEARSTGPTSNSRPACVISQGLAQFQQQEGDADSIGGTFTGFSNNPETQDRGDDDCDDFNDRRVSANQDQRGSDTEGFDTTIDPATGLAIDDGVPFAFAPSQRHYRQNDTRDTRDSFFGALQWQPNDRLDINADLQYSERIQTEIRADLTFNGGRRNDTSLNIGTGTDVTTFDTLDVTDSGAILYSVTDNSVEVQGGDYERNETYIGGGLAGSYDVSDKLTLSADLSYSKTERNEFATEYRLQSDISPVIQFDNRGDVPLYTLSDEVFDVNDHDLFVDRLRIRIDNDLERENTATALRLDGDYELDQGIFTNIQAGIRASEMNYLALDGGDGGNPGRIEIEFRNNNSNTDNNFGSRIRTPDDSESDVSIDTLSLANRFCRTNFEESDFLGSLRDGDLVTNIDDAGNVISSTNSWATFDVNCLAELAVNSVNANGLATDPDTGEIIQISSGLPSLVEEFQTTIDMTEQTNAIYAMANYETTLGTTPVRGNVGVRVVNTSVESVGYRNSFTINDNAGIFTISANDDTIRTVAEYDYTEVLPSFTAIFDLNDETLVRIGAFKALSRADPADMGFSRTIQVQNEDGDGEDITDPNNLVSGVVASGNPEFEPLTSWNFDAGVEYYPNDDTILAVGGYYKRFIGGFQNVVQNETFNIDGQDVTFGVSVPATSDEESDLYGIELTASHRFSYLPSYWSGLGAKVSYNYADSNFEFEDSRYGDAFRRELDGSLTQLADGIIAPANIPGLSKHVLSAQVYYQIGDLDLQGIYKYRSQYFQPFTSDGTRIRYVGDVGVFEARASYKINDNFKLSVEAINLFDEPKEQFAFVDDDRYEINQYGPRIFFGIKGKF